MKVISLTNSECHLYLHRNKLYSSWYQICLVTGVVLLFCNTTTCSEEEIRLECRADWHDYKPFIARMPVWYGRWQYTVINIVVNFKGTLLLWISRLLSTNQSGLILVIDNYFLCTLLHRINA